MVAVTKRRTRQKPADRRDSILEEAFGLIGQHGFNGFTVQALAARCDLSNAGILYHFGSKDGVLLALLDELERRDAVILSPLVEDAAQSRETDRAHEALMVLLHAMAERCVSRPALDRFALTLQSEAIDPTHPGHDWFRVREQMMLDLFTRLLSSLVPEPEVTARHICALLIGLAQQWVRSGSAFDLVGQCDKAFETILRGACEPSVQSN
ncbi:TetR family transcriptional regulator [Sphingomonas sp. LH128]|uniref:TetR/AcrR family transcriptional regulator n=1 Tax=Sphingomonas sp. LH128 TaxID=473781 RepID=UPI00027CB4D3|nr:TetR/AcrR family transcriptional regulator [Sphingomonas sp. LH128]EJU14477.1 TetR family transcriptional regulator [Sphingomonas sp. LH128]